MGDRAAGDVETSHPEVRDAIRLLGTSSPIQEVSTVEGGQVPIREPVRIPDAPQRDVVSKGDEAAHGLAPEGERAVESPTLSNDQNPILGDNVTGPRQDSTLWVHGSDPNPTILCSVGLMQISRVEIVVLLLACVYFFSNLV